MNVEGADKNHSIAVDYQFEKNIYSDSQLEKDYLDKQPVSEEATILVTDGGYFGYENVKQTAGKNADIITTDLKGDDMEDIFADFKFLEDGNEIISCPAGHRQKSNVYDINAQNANHLFK